MLGIAGVGYVGKRLLERLPAPVMLLSRSQAQCKAWTQAGHIGCVADLDRPESLPAWNTSLDCLFYFVPPSPQGTEDPRMSAFLSWIAANPPRRLVYISTSGVYGNCQGDWVDELAPLLPGNDRARRRVNAENQLSAFMEQYSTEVVVLRVPGIYGPERLPLQRLQSGEPVICPNEAPFSNRIHVDDLVTCCLAAMERGKAGQAYNVCDDAPSTMTDYLYAVADASGLERPRCVGLDEAEGVISKGMMSYLKESRRLRNQRMHEELGVELMHPTLTDALKAMKLTD